MNNGWFIVTDTTEIMKHRQFSCLSLGGALYRCIEVAMQLFRQNCTPPIKCLSKLHSRLTVLLAWRVLLCSRRTEKAKSAASCVEFMARSCNATMLMMQAQLTALCGLICRVVRRGTLRRVDSKPSGLGQAVSMATERDAE